MDDSLRDDTGRVEGEMANARKTSKTCFRRLVGLNLVFGIIWDFNDKISFFKSSNILLSMSGVTFFDLFIYNRIIKYITLIETVGFFVFAFYFKETDGFFVKSLYC